MRITKTIREYLERCVRNKAHQSPKYLELSKAMKQEKEAFESAVETVKTRADAEIRAIVDQYNCVNKYSYNRDSLVSTYVGGYETPAEKAFFDYKLDLDAQIADKIENIIISLELGGTKEMLEEFLQEISFD